MLFLKRQRDLSVFLRFGAFYFSGAVGIVPVLFGKSTPPPLLKYGCGVAKMQHLDGIALPPFLIQ
jgi:hypothetical protein